MARTIIRKGIGRSYDDEDFAVGLAKLSASMPSHRLAQSGKVTAYFTTLVSKLVDSIYVNYTAEDRYS